MAYILHILHLFGRCKKDALDLAKFRFILHHFIVSRLDFLALLGETSVENILERNVPSPRQCRNSIHNKVVAVQLDFKHVLNLI